MAITSMEVIDGFANHSDFEWSWGQHAPHLIPNGNIMLFDNGDNRNFVGYGPYSRNVEYDIDEDNMTIRQVWQYGKERGNETFSRYFSDVDYDPEDHHVFFSPGGVINMDRYGKVIELDYSTGDVIFEATVFPPLAVPVTFHRTERMPLYAD
jgi:arylsulfate sulfotransferase